ncbi:MAG: carbohydrate kinase family protein [Promethearchaeota archaeon]
MKKKAILVGEMHNDLFYKCDAFKKIKDAIALTVFQKKKAISKMSLEEIQELVEVVMKSEPKKIKSKALIKRGGNGNNSSEIFATLGVPVKLMTVVGAGSDWMINEVEKLGVDTSCVYQVDDATPISTIIEDPLITKIFVAPNMKDQMNFSTIDIEPSTFSDASLIFFTPLFAKFKPVLNLITYLKLDITKAVTIERQAIENIKELKQNLVSKVDLLFTNIQDILEITNTKNIDDADEILKEYGSIRIYTLGSEGSLVKCGFSDDIRVPIFKVNVIDRTGAGDSFAGGFLMKCLEYMAEKNDTLINICNKATRKEINKIMYNSCVMGNVVAALKISLGRTPTRDEVEEFLEKHEVKMK